MSLRLRFAWTLSAALVTAILPATQLRAAEIKSSAALLEVDRVELLGVTALEGQDVESALEIIAGDSLERSKVVRSLENLQALYRARGFEQVRVKSELVRERGDEGRLENVVRIRVEEGQPTRIASVRIELPLQETGKRTRAFRDLAQSLGIRPGDLLDQEKLAEARRFIQERLGVEEFVGGRAEEKVITLERVAADLSRDYSAGRWVELVLQVELGEKVGFGFRGNRVFTSGQLGAMVEELRSVGFGKDYVGAVQAKIEDEYRKSGYARVRVSSFAFEGAQDGERRISYVIEEGPRVVLSQISFEGQAFFSAQRLREEFKARAPALTSNGYYSAVEIEKTSELLVEWMRSQGFLSAKTVTIQRSYNSRGDEASLMVYLFEGQQTVIESISLDGAQAISRSEVLSLLGLQEGKPLDLFSFTEGIEVVKALYRRRGYLDARIRNEGTDSVVRYSDENRVARIRLELDEGKPAVVSRIEVEGLSGTREKVVLRELPFKVGSGIDEGKIQEGESRLRKLGVFSSAEILVSSDPRGEGLKRVRVSVQEGTPGLLAGGVGFRNDLGVRVFGQTAYTNLHGRNHTASLSANMNRRFTPNFCSKGMVGGPDCFLEYQVELGYVWPWFAFGETTFRPKISLERTIFRLLDTDAAIFSATLARPLLRSPQLTASLSYSLERIRQFNARSSEDNDNLRIGSITPTLRLDLRDNPLVPTRGFYAETSYEYAATSLGSQGAPLPIGYSRAQFRTDLLLPVPLGIIASLSFRTGLERNFENQIPLSKQFALGGVTSLRGFREQELNIQSTSVTGFASYVNYRSELSFPFTGALRIVPFLDAANLLVDDYSLGNLRYGAGAGLHYLSPVGPVNFDWGFKLRPLAGEDSYRFYFSIGVL